MEERYEERGPIGEGGMSSVLRVFDRVLFRETAQKLMDPRFAERPEYVDRFMREARVTGQLEHPNIVPVHDFGRTPDGQPFINMKLVEGDTLGELVAQAGPARLSPDHLAGFVRIVLKVCDAIAFAHSRGVVHRDLTPTNVMVGPFGEVYVMDWGVSSRLDGSAVELGPDRPERSQGISGTPAYMAPEQIRGEPVDERTDVFGLGAILYEVVTGGPPYPGPTAVEALNQALEAAWPPLEEVLGLRSPTGLDMVISRAMAPAPADRYPSVQALQSDLAAWVRGRWHLPTRVYAEGDVVVQEGDSADEAYLIVGGTCEARRQHRDRMHTLSRMGPGDAFGEMAIFGEVRRTSTVVATSELRVQVVNRSNLTAAAGLDSWVGQFVGAVTSRFLEAEARLQELQDQLERMKTQLEAFDRLSEKA